MTESEKESFYTEIGNNIKNARERANLKQEAFAKLIGLSRVSVVNIERGKQNPPLHILWDISKALKITLHDLLPSYNFHEAELDDELNNHLEEKIIKSMKATKIKEESFDLIRSFIIDSKNTSK